MSGWVGLPDEAGTQTLDDGGSWTDILERALTELGAAKARAVSSSEAASRVASPVAAVARPQLRQRPRPLASPMAPYVGSQAAAARARVAQNIAADLAALPFKRQLEATEPEVMRRAAARSRANDERFFWQNPGMAIDQEAGWLDEYMSPELAGAIGGSKPMTDYHRRELEDLRSSFLNAIRTPGEWPQDNDVIDAMERKGYKY